MNVDIVTGATPPTYTVEFAKRLPSFIDHQLIRSKAYAHTTTGTAYRLVHHSMKVRLTRRKRALLHVDTQLLAYVLALGQREPTILSCHDLIQFEEEFDDPSYVFRRRLSERVLLQLVRRGILGATCVMVASEYIREELIRFGVPVERIELVPWAVDTGRFHPMDRMQCRELLAKYLVPRDRPLVLHVGSEHPRKNLPNFLRAFVKVRMDAMFATVGSPRQPQRAELERLIKELGLQKRVILVDGVSAEELPIWYNAADLFVLPSLHEGFGLPPLEAMACGTPVAVANVAALPEVVGDAAVLFNPRDEADILRAIERVLQDPATGDRLRAKGVIRASGFPWEQTVRGIVQAYRKAAGET